MDVPAITAHDASPIDTVMHDTVRPKPGGKMKLEIEFGGGTPAYGKLHKAGCRDLIDGYEVGECATKDEAMTAADDATGWEQEVYEFAPCVKFPQR